MQVGSNLKGLEKSSGKVAVNRKNRQTSINQGLTGKEEI